MLHLGDITKINGADVPPVNVVIGGSPCQDLSVAGKRAGLSGERSGLFIEQLRIIKEMRRKDIENGAVIPRPRYMVWENVPGAFSSNKGEDFRIVLEETAKVVEPTATIPRPEKGKWANSGAVMGDGWSIAWRVFDAQFWGVPQRRRRIALVADFGGQSAPEILFERKGVSRYTPPRTTPWKDFAAIIAKRFNSSNRGERIADFDTVPLNTMVCTRQANEIKTCLGVGEINDPQFTISAGHEHAVAYSFDSLSSNSMKSSNPNSGCRKVDVAKTIDTTIPGPSKNQGGIAIVYDALGNGNGETAPTIKGDHNNRITDYTALCVRERCGCEGGGKGCLVQEDQSGALATNNDQFVCAIDRAAFNQGINAQYNPEISESGINSTLTAKGPGAVCESVVRRLTPLECERLQGFPDGWTDIGEYIDTTGKKRKTSDTARYKALGNSIALPPWAWLLERLSRYCEGDYTMASLFDGIGGFPLIWEALNGEGTCLWASEIDEFPIAVTKRHFS